MLCMLLFSLGNCLPIYEEVFSACEEFRIEINAWPINWSLNWSLSMKGIQRFSHIVSLIIIFNWTANTFFNYLGQSRTIFEHQPSANKTNALSNCDSAAFQINAIFIVCIYNHMFISNWELFTTNRDMTKKAITLLLIINTSYCSNKNTNVLKLKKEKTATGERRD